MAFDNEFKIAKGMVADWTPQVEVDAVMRQLPRDGGSGCCGLKRKKPREWHR